MHRALRLLFIIAAVAALAGGCSSSSGSSADDTDTATTTTAESDTTTGGESSDNGYDATAVEGVLIDTQKGAVGDLELGDAECPEDVVLTEGVTFDCTLEIGDVVAPYTVDITKVDTDNPTVHVIPKRAIVATSKAIEFLRGNLADEFADAEVNCGDTDAVLADPGDTFDCTIMFDGDTQTVSVLVKDLKGTITVAP